MRWIGCCAVALCLSITCIADANPRLIVTTDIGGDPDDSQSLVRLLTYANELDIEGLIASASGTPGELDRAVTRTDLIQERVRAYGRVLPQLRLHDPDYPDEGDLWSRIKRGNAQRGRSAIGEGHDTEASNFIISVADQPDERPLYIAIWGGQTDVAQALWRVRHDRSTAELNAFIAKLRIYDIADQDGLFDWIHTEFPNLWYILNKAPQGEDKRNAVFRGMYLDGDVSVTSTEWLRAHVTTGHGPLGALYPDEGLWTAPNPHGALKEGDTPSWLYVLPMGLSDPVHPEFGSWGGRFERIENHLFRDAADQVNDITNARMTVARWREKIQHDFAARMDWCVQDVEAANHPPVPILQGDSTLHVLYQQAVSGSTVELQADASYDPDGDPLSFHWWMYEEPSTIPDSRITLIPDGPFCNVRIGETDTPFSLHIILEVTDCGEPPLTRYRRIMLKSEPSVY